MSLMLFGQVLWLIAPVVIGGLIHVWAIKMNVWPGLAKKPLDGGRCFRGRRWLGDNKTVRGALVMVLATVGCAALQSELVRRVETLRELSLIDIESVPPLLWGTVLGIGYILGELPNSFLKRQLDIPPGGSATGIKGAVFWLADQLDSLLGVLVLMPLVWVPPLSVVLALLLVTLAIHPAVALLMFTLGLKNRVG
jgi:hypothetical protein